MAQSSLEQVISAAADSSVQGRDLHTSSRSRKQPPLPLEHMEPIAEERSELAMDIAQAVVEKLDIDRKLDERMKELMLRGDRIFRDIQHRQEQSSEALCRSVGMCLESQRTFHGEHQRLLAAVRDLATMVLPFTSLGGQALEVQARATAIAEETEQLRKTMEENTLSAFSGAAALAQAPVQLPVSPTPALTTTPVVPAVQPQGAANFSITLRKADDVSLGLTVNADEVDGKALVVESVLPGGAVDSWNRQCFSDATAERAVTSGDRIVRVNGYEGDVKKMLEECTNQRLVKLVISRNENSERNQIGNSQHQCVSTLRRKAPEFVPSGADAPPLQQTQHLAAPPGLFFARPEENIKKPVNGIQNELSSAAKMEAHALVARVVSNGYQDCINDEKSSDKEN